MRKKSLLVLLMLVALMSTILGTGTANAALKETSLSKDGLVTESGIFNRLDWEKTGENADTVYTEAVQGNILRWNSNVWAACWLVSWDPVDFSKGDIYLEFDILAWDGMIRPVFTPVANGITSIAKTIWLSSGGLVNGEAYEGTKNYNYYSDYDCTKLYAETMGDPESAKENGNAWYSVAPTGNGTRVRLTFKSDGTLGIQRAAIQDDGTYAEWDKTAIYMKNAYPGLAEGATYYMGINGQGRLDIDNFKISYADGTQVIGTEFENADWQELEGSNKPGKILNFKGSMTKVAEYLVSNPANTNLTISKAAITIDEDVNEAFTLKSEISIREAGKAIGFAFGMADSSQAIDDEGTSFVFFENVDVPASGTEGEEGYVAAHKETAVNVMKGGVKGQPVLLGSDLTGANASFVPVVIDGYKNGDIKVTVDGEEVATFTEQNIEGKVAIATWGEGNVTAAFGIDLSLVTYSYRGSEGSEIATNFNTGYVNPENWGMSSVKAVNFENIDEAVGLTLEDGALFFKGTGDHTYFSSLRSYADYVLEFDYITYHVDDKPALKSSWTHGYSDLAVNLGCQSGDGWANSIMICLKQEAGIVQMQNYKGGLSTVVDGPALPEGTSFNPAEAGKALTNKVKIVVAANEIKVYLITVQEGAEPTSDDFVLAATFTVPDTYGIVSFGTTDCGYFKVDNVRITPIDDKDPAKLQENLANYKDLQTIADEYRPVTLDAPEVTLSGNVASWAAVEDATGYIININGETTTVGADVLSYTFEQTEPGDYVLTVVAVGNGDYISDSEQSEAVTYTVAGSSSGCGDCNSGASVALIGLLAAAAALIKVRK